MAWGGHALTAAQSRPSLQYRIPEEGALLTLDSWAIPANAPHPELAHRFIDHALSPENARLNSQAMLFNPPLQPELPAMQALASQHPNLFPGPSEWRRLYFLEQPSAKVKQAVSQHWDALVRQEPHH